MKHIKKTEEKMTNVEKYKDEIIKLIKEETNNEEI